MYRNGAVEEGIEELCEREQKEDTPIRRMIEIIRRRVHTVPTPHNWDKGNDIVIN